MDNVKQGTNGAFNLYLVSQVKFTGDICLEISNLRDIYLSHLNPVVIGMCNGVLTAFLFAYRICVSECPPGHYYAEKKRCKKCFPNCEICVGSRSDQCTACKPGYYLNIETNSCTTNCPDGFYLNESRFSSRLQYVLFSTEEGVTISICFVC